MNADPKCLVCQGSGYSEPEIPCCCTEHVRRDPYVAGKSGWAGDALAGVMASAQRRHEEREAHANVCTDRPCTRCERYVCACGKPFDGARNHRCRDCWRTEKNRQALDPMRGSVPKRFRWAFDATTDALRGRVKASDEFIARGLASPPSGDMVLYGDTAMGKTSFAVAMLDAWVRQDPEQRAGARFFEAYWLAGARARHPLGQGESPEVLAAMNASMLLLDDVGSETDDRRNVVADIIFHRHNEELPTWITTGFTAEQLVGRYGSQVLRRILEHGKGVKLGSRS